MRIGHVITGLETGGAEMMLLKICLALQSKGVSSKIVTLQPGLGRIGTELQQHGIEVLSMNVKYVGLTKYFLAKSFLADCDLIQGWMYHGNLFSLLLANKRPLVWNVRQSLSNYSNEKLMLKGAIKLNSWLSHIPASIIFNSKLAMKQHEEIGFNPTKSIFIGNGFDANLLKRDFRSRENFFIQENIPESYKVILNLGRFHRDKNQADFIKMAKTILKERRDLIFVMAGAGVTDQNQELRVLISDDVVGHFRLIGEQSDINKLLSAADYLVQTSSAEAFPNVLGEAMSCEVPCIATDVGDSLDIIGNSGLIVPVPDVEQLKLKLLEALKWSNIEYSERQSKGRQRIIEKFSIETVANQYLELYEAKGALCAASRAS